MKPHFGQVGRSTPPRCKRMLHQWIKLRTGDPKFAVMQPFPAAISEKEADPFLM